MPSPTTAELLLPGVTSSVPAARRFVRQTLTAWGLEAVVDAAMLVVSELATNAVLHARSDFTVRLGRDEDGTLRLEVADRSARQPQSRSYGVGSTTGRGLSIVDDLVRDWGVLATPEGKRIWVQLEVDEAERDPDESAPPDTSKSRAPHGRRNAAPPDGPVALAA